MYHLKKVTFLLLFTCTLNASAFEVIKYIGSVKIDGKELKDSKDFPQKSALIETGAKSFAKLRLDKHGSVMNIGPNSSISLDNKKAIKHLSGSLLFNFKGKIKSKKTKLILKTKVAAFGVRGTEFMSVVNPLLGETEIITFEGSVLFASLSDKKDRKIVKANQWGGLGGRFGNEVGEILDLPKNVISTFYDSFSF